MLEFSYFAFVWIWISWELVFDLVNTKMIHFPKVLMGRESTMVLLEFSSFIIYFGICVIVQTHDYAIQGVMIVFKQSNYRAMIHPLDGRQLLKSA